MEQRTVEEAKKCSRDGCTTTEGRVMPEVLWCKRLACFFWQPGWLRRSILVVNGRKPCIVRISVKASGKEALM
jgi:hypothetical protein